MEGTEAVLMAEAFMVAIFAAAVLTIGVFMESGNFAVADSGSVVSSVVTIPAILDTELANLSTYGTTTCY
jgi:hypothetical protein